MADFYPPITGWFLAPTDIYPKTLFRPICHYCNKELFLGRSGKHPSFCCVHGRSHMNGCKLHTYKSVRIVEESMLRALKEHILTPDVLAALLERANEFLREEAKRPREDTAPLLAEIKALDVKRHRLVRVLEGAGEDGLGVVVRRIRKCERKLEQLRRSLKELEFRNEPPPAPMTSADVERLLTDLRELLAEDVAQAAPILAELTGPITVKEGGERGTKGMPWVAEFTVNVVPVFAWLSASRDCPTTDAWAYLNNRGWTTAERVEIAINDVPKCVEIAEQVAKLTDLGVSPTAIAAAIGCNRETVVHSLVFLQTGKQPRRRRGRQQGGKRLGPPKYKELSPDVCRLREEGLTFPQIALRLQATYGVVLRAYDHAHRAEIRANVQATGKPNRGGRNGLGAKCK
jgi:hypothetical protein